MDEQRTEQHIERRPQPSASLHGQPVRMYAGESTSAAGPEEPLRAPAEPVATKRPSIVREIIETLLLALIIFVAVRAVVLNFRVDGHSMKPSLINNEMLLVNRNAYFAFDEDQWLGWIPGVETDPGADPSYPFGKPERGDIIVLDPPASASADKPYIKRVIGEAGDTVEIRGDQVFIDGERLNEPYIDGGDWECRPVQTCGPLTVPDDSVFVLGDNRGNSEDSRVFGVVPIQNIIGKAWITYWPLEQMEFVPHEDYPELSG